MKSTVRTIAEWLASLGLSEYAERFAENHVDASVLRDLTDQDLTELGVPLGHRRKMLRAIAELDGAAPEPAEAATEPVPRDDAERRHLTVMFCDLVGSDALSARLDPEDMWGVIASYHACIGEVVGRHQGMIARYMDEGVLAYFGYPRAQEDDAEQAVRAALVLVDAVATLQTNVDTALQVRIGIATGTVVVSELLIGETPAEQAVIGETPNLAARLQTLAEPGTVLICPQTRRLTGGHFDYRDLGPRALKGLAEPVAIWQVLGPSGVASRFEAMHKTKLPPLFGREEEIELLLRRWRYATQGEGRVALLTGEPGIGKSHIALALGERLHSESHIALRYFCSAHHTNSALFPFIGQLERAAGFGRKDSPTEKLSKLDALVAQSTADSEHVAVLANLFALPASDRYQLQELSPQKRKEKTLAALLAQLDALAARQPVFMIFEDVHWIDPTSLELLTATVEHVPRLRVLLLITARSEFTPPWPSYPHTTTIPLTRLSRRAGAALVERVTGGKTLPKEVMDEILARTDGVPLFIEELTKTVLESGLLQERNGHYVLERPLPSLAIPTTLHASLMARLDRLVAVREVAQIGAVAGREFHYELLYALAGMPRERLEDALGQLVRSELIFCRGEIPHAVYAFKHALVRDAAYASLLKSRRGQLHAAIANALEQQFPEIVQTQPETLARHLSEAGLAEKAIGYWLRAGKSAALRSANAEAIVHLQRGLELLQSLPDDSAQKQVALEFEVLLGQTMIAARGYAAPETMKVLLRAKKLITDSTETSLKFAILYGVWACYYVGGQADMQQLAAAEFLAEAERCRDAGTLCLAHRAMGTTYVTMGEFAAARRHLEQARALHDPDRPSQEAFHYGQDIGATVLCYLSWALWHLGYVEQASEVADDAVRRAEAIPHPFTLVYTLCHARGMMDVFRRRSEDTQSYAGVVLSLCAEHEFPFWAAGGQILSGWAATCQGDVEAGVEAINRGLGAWRETGARLWLPMFLALEAEGHAKAGRNEAALHAIEQALAMADETGERWAVAEVLRIKAGLLLAGGPSRANEAESLLTKSLEIARRQQALCWELRTSCDLARLWQRRGRGKDALKLLRSIHGQFTEGLETPDLKAAKALMESLTEDTVAKA
jgi:class 3 adenylate cyclase/predicted ATPase